MGVDLLLVSFYYPPYPGVGSRRWGFLSRFFAENGYAVAVLTSPLSSGKETTPEPAGHENLTVYTVAAPSWRPPHIPRLPFIEEWFTWQRTFRQSLERLIRQEHPRLLVFTGGPFFSFTMAPGLGKRFHIPYWLDFRDAWDLGSHGSLRFSAPLVRYLERRAVRNARIITDVTKEMAALRRVDFPNLPSEHFQVLENGFEGSPITPSSSTHPDTVLRLGIWGKFSSYHSDHPSILVAAIAELVAKIPIEIHHFGTAGEEKALAEAAARYSLSKVLHFHSYCDYEAGLAFLATMDIMVVNHRSPLLVGTKVFDAIRINRPILALCRPEDALARLLRPFRHAYLAESTAETAAALHDIVRLKPGCLDPELAPEPYSRQRQGQKFLPILASLLGPR